MHTFNPTCRIDNLNAYFDFSPVVDLLRLDLLDPIISGNKWFKLKHYLEEATAQNKGVLTFGGAYSNHIVATAAAAKQHGVESAGIIRGERPTLLSPSLLLAESFGMHLHFISREDYRQKKLPSALLDRTLAGAFLVIPEGGYGEKGMLGASDILWQNNTAQYTQIITATGTGTTLAGLVNAAVGGQKITGISVLKNNFSLEQEVDALLPVGKRKTYQIVHDYHFGGYAKKTDALLSLMNDFFRETGIQLDFVYTAKMMFGVFDLLSRHSFSADDKLLLLHTGGLQGNLSLPKGTLIYR